MPFGFMPHPTITPVLAPLPPMFPAVVASVSQPGRTAISSDSTLEELAVYQGSGLVMVLVSLIVLWGLAEIMARFFRRLPSKTQSRIAPPTESEPDNEARAPGGMAVDPPIAAAIAATVFMVLGKDARIVGMRRANQPPANPQLAAWTIQGRLQHHSSHRVR